MAWVKLDDGFPEHPKVQEAGGDAAWLHVCALAYCNRNTTDGFIAFGVLARLSDRRTPRKLAECLVAAGLWDAQEGGWTIHDYLEFQPSKAKVDAERAAARERMAALRADKEAKRSSAEVRANNERSSDEVRSTRPDPVYPVHESPPTPPSLDCPEGVDNPSERLIEIADNYARIAYQQAVASGRQIRFEDRYKAKAKSTALSHDDIGRLAAEFPTAPADAVAAWLHGDKGSMRYYQRADELAAAEDGPEIADVIEMRWA